MKLQTHEKILRFVLGLPRKKLKVVYVEAPYKRFDMGEIVHYSFEERTVFVRDDAPITTLAHEFYHAWQHKKMHRRRIRKNFENFKYPPNEYSVWGYRRYKYQYVERTANRFCLNYSFFTFEYDAWWKRFKSEVSTFFTHYLMLQLIIDLFYRKNEEVEESDIKRSRMDRHRRSRTRLIK